MSTAQETQVQEKAASIRRLLDQISLLSAGNLPLADYFNRFLDLTIRALDADGGAVWLDSGNGHQALCSKGLQDVFSTNDPLRERIQQALAAVAERRGMLVGLPAAGAESATQSAANPPFPLMVFAPCLLSNHAAAILQITWPPATDPERAHAVQPFLKTITVQAEIYLRNQRLETLTVESRKLGQMVVLLAEMHGELNPTDLSMTIANHAREITGVDRVSIAVRHKSRERVLAVSGVESVDAKSVLIRAILTLSRQAMTADAPKHFLKGDEVSSDEEVTEYFLRGNMRAAYVVPFKDRHGRAIGALACETVRPEGVTEAQRKLAQAVARPAGHALGAAEEVSNIPLLNTLRTLRHRGEALIRSKRRSEWLLMAAGIFLFVFALPLPLRIAGDCQLLPAKRGAAVSEIEGRIAAVHAHEGQLVQPGALIAELDASELEKQLAVTEQERARWDAEAQRFRASQEETAQAARRVAEMAASRSELEAGRLRAAMEKTRIRSPIEGVVLTGNLEARVGEVLEKGDVLATIGDPRGWKAVIEVVEADVAPIDQRLRRGKTVAVAVLTRGWTTRKLRGQVRESADISQITYPAAAGGGKTQVFYVTATLDVNEADAALLRAGFSGRAKLYAGWRPIGFLATRRIMDYLRVHWFL